MIKEVKIKYLFNKYDVHMRFNDEGLLIVSSRNGKGKTTILNIIYYILSYNLSDLYRYDFDFIEIMFENNQSLKIDRDSLIPKINNIKTTISRSSLFNILKNSIDVKHNELLDVLYHKAIGYETIKQNKYLDDLLEKNFIPKFILDEFKHFSNSYKLDVDVFSYHSSLTKKLKLYLNSYNADVIYLPTFRRIENSFKVFKFSTDLNLNFKQSDLIGTSKSLINFGMGDIYEGLKKYNEEIKYHLLESFIAKPDERDTHAKSFEDLDSKMKNFIKVCNKYLINKKILSSDYQTTIIDENNNELDWEMLSSGEKQIVSIFYNTHLRNKKFILLMDEPEISLSIEWQETLIEDIQSSNNCLSALIMTHSPFIFSNEKLRSKTVDLSYFFNGHS